MEELPARHEEVEHAIEEGVIFKTQEPEAETFLRGKGYKLVDKF